MSVPVRRLQDVAAALLLMAVLAVCVHLIVGGPDDVPRAVGWPHTQTAYDNGALNDLRDGLYYPGRALLDGHNPYDVAGTWARYPTTNWLPLYGPAHLLLGAPLALLPFGVASAVWVTLSVGVLLGFSWLAVRAATERPRLGAVLLVAAVVLALRPGRETFVAGQSTLIYAGATWLAWAWSGSWERAGGVRIRPWWAAAAMAVALTKPPFGLPLVVLLLVQGQWRVVLRGVGLCAAVSAPVVAALLVSTDGPSRLMQHLLDNLEHTTSSVPDQVGGVRRIDAASLLARILPEGVPDTALEVGAAVAVLALSAVFLRKAGRAGAHPAVTATVAAAAVVLSVPHQTYDLLLLAAPVCALIAAHRAVRPLVVVAAGLVAAAAVPAGLLLRAVGRPGDLGVVTSLTSAAALLLLLVAVATHRAPASAPVAAHVAEPE